MAAMAQYPGRWATRPDVQNHRLQTRYELSLDLICQPVDGSHNWYQSNGKTVDISSGGALIEIDRTLEPGERVECCVNWPTPPGRPDMHLVFDAVVLRSDGNRAAVSFIRRFLIPVTEHDRRMRRRFLPQA